MFLLNSRFSQLFARVPRFPRLYLSRGFKRATPSLTRAAQLFRRVFLLAALKVVNEARRGAFGNLFQIALHERLALLLDVAAHLASQVSDHPELFRRHQIAQRPGPRIAQDARRDAVLLDHVGFTAIQVTRDAEFHRGAFQRVVFGLLDAGLAFGRAGSDALARYAVNGDRGGHRNQIAHLRDVADGVRPVGRDAIQDVRHGVPFDVFDPVGLPLAIGPSFARLDQPWINRLAQRAQQVREDYRHDLRRLRRLRLIRDSFSLNGLRDFLLFHYAVHLLFLPVRCQ